MTTSTRRAVLVAPPVVGHVNSAIALALILQGGGWDVRIVTGRSCQGYLRQQSLPVPWRTLPSLDFETNRVAPGYRPHLEQLSDPAVVRRQVADLAEVNRDFGARVLIAKDCFAAVLLARVMGVPYVGYFTDGLEALSPRTTRQGLPTDGIRCRALNLVADELSVRHLESLPGALRSPELNLVRGFPETSSISLEDEERDIQSTCQFVGFSTYDAPAAVVSLWRSKLARLAHPFVYVTLGTATSDVAVLGEIERALSDFDGTLLIALPDYKPLRASTQSARYVPNSSAMAYADLVVHHGGHGTFLTALRHGVPQLVLPQNARTQQAAHGRQAVTLGVGFSSTGIKNPADFRALVQGLGHDGSTRKRALTLAGVLVAADRRRIAELLARLDRLVS